MRIVKFLGWVVVGVSGLKVIFVSVFVFEQESEEKSFNRRFHGGFDVRVQLLLFNYISGVDWHEAERVLIPLIMEKKNIAGFSTLFWKAFRSEKRWLQLLEGA